MTRSATLQTQLQTILYGQAWYGTPISTILQAVTFKTAYQKPAGATHNIAEIVMHMLAWTEETTTRMQGTVLDEPLRGDWPDVSTPDEDKWQQLVANLKLANAELLHSISNFPEDKWHEPTNDTRGTYNGYGLTYEALIAGIMQHHVYHIGQISLLNKTINHG